MGELEEGLRVLETVRTPNSNADLVDLDWASAIAAVDGHGVPMDVMEPEEPWTRASFIEFVTRIAGLCEFSYEELVSYTLREAKRYIVQAAFRIADDQAEAETRALEHGRLRQCLEREAILPTPAMQDRLQRAEAHLDRRFAKLLVQLELLQRMRTGSYVAPPVRIQVTE